MKRPLFVRRLGVNFTNVLRAAFTHANLKSTKKTIRLSSFFALLGSGHVKAAHRMLVKLTPGRRRRRLKNVEWEEKTE